MVCADDARPDERKNKSSLGGHATADEATAASAQRAAERKERIEDAEGGHLDRIGLLCELRCELNHLTSDGRTALTYAVQAGNVGCVKLLLDRKADATLVRINLETWSVPARGEEERRLKLTSDLTAELDTNLGEEDALRAKGNEYTREADAAAAERAALALLAAHPSGEVRELMRASERSVEGLSLIHI